MMMMCYFFFDLKLRIHEFGKRNEMKRKREYTRSYILDFCMIVIARLVFFNYLKREIEKTKKGENYTNTEVEQKQKEKEEKKQYFVIYSFGELNEKKKKKNTETERESGRETVKIFFYGETHKKSSAKKRRKTRSEREELYIL